MDFKDMKIGFALTGSFCTFTRILEVMRGLVEEGADVHPVFSKNVSEMDSRFWKSREFIAKVQEITGQQGIFTIPCFILLIYSCFEVFSQISSKASTPLPQSGHSNPSGRDSPS